MTKLFRWISKKNIGTYAKIWKIVTDEGDDFPTGILLGYLYFKNCYNMIVIDADPKAI